MRYIKKYDNYKPITVNSEKPFEIDDNIDSKIDFLHKKIQSLRKRLDEPKRKRDRLAHSKMNDEKNKSILKLKDLQFKKIKQQAYLKEHPPIKESVDTSKDLVSNLKSDEFEPSDIFHLMGLDENKYEFATSTGWGRYAKNDYDENGFTIYIDEEYLSELMDIEDEGVLRHILSFDSSYNYYEYYVDDELNYLHNYISEETQKNIVKLAKLFNYEIELDKNEIAEGEINDLFNYLSLNRELDDIKAEISMEHERAIEKAANAIINELPYSIEFAYAKKFNFELYFEYDKIIDYIKEHKLKVNSIKEFIENVDNSDFSYDFEYNREYEFLGDFEGVKKEIENIVSNLLEFPDEVFPKMIKDNNLEAFKKNVELANFSYPYDAWISYERFNGNLFELAKKSNFPEILNLLRSKDFEDFMNNRSVDEQKAYHEFILGEDAVKYNL